MSELNTDGLFQKHIELMEKNNEQAYKVGAILWPFDLSGTNIYSVVLRGQESINILT